MIGLILYTLYVLDKHIGMTVKKISKQCFVSPHVYCDILPKSSKQHFAVYKINLNSTRHSQTCIPCWPNLKANFMLGCVF